MNKMLFCEICGKILEITNKNNKIIGLCSCGYSKETDFEVSFSEDIKKSEVGEGVINENEETIGFPHVCMKCGHNECEIWDLGVQIGDESNITLYRCKKCKYVERQADGTGNN